MAVENFLKERAFVEIDHPYALISIYSAPGEDLLTEENRRLLGDRCAGALSTCFGDLDPVKQGEDVLKKIKEKNGIVPIAWGQATEIVEFVRRVNRTATVLYVHCDAGVSRSGAVGQWVAEEVGVPDGEFREMNKNILPNRHILRTLREVAK
jgi:hypothetical protein